MPPAALITGVATGIGRAVALALAAKGHNLTLLDLDENGMNQTAGLVRSSHPGVEVVTQKVDVTSTPAQEAAFSRHMTKFGRLDVAFLNAGIGERGHVLDPGTPQAGGWQLTLDVDLTAVIVGIRCASIHMESTGGTIISVASAGGLFPMPAAPVYASSKAGVVHFTRSIAQGLSKKGIRAMALCPEYVDTPLIRSVIENNPSHAVRLLGSLDIKLLQPDYVADVVIQMLDPKYPGGTCMRIRQTGELEFPTFPHPGKGKPGSGTPVPGSTTSSTAVRGLPTSPGQAAAVGAAQRAYQAALTAWAVANPPTTYQKIQVHTLSSRFQDATRLVQVPLGPGLSAPAGALLLRRVAVGINASDINYTAGRYYGSTQAAASKLPFDAGFESVSVVAAVGEGAKGFKVGDPVATLTYDGFSEWGVVPARQALPVPRATPDIVALLTSGLTASIALEVAGQLKSGDTLLVTAAAGGTGQFAVQLGKLAGCHVIATCGGPDKARMLKALGADRVVDYKTEKLKDVLKKEYPKGVDVVYESVGGDMFSAAVDALAPRGRLIVIGMMGSYAEGWPASNHPGLAEKLLWKSAAVVGFFLLRYPHHFRPHLQRLIQLLDAGKLQVSIDPVKFVGISSVPAAVERLYSGASVGKVVVQLANDVPLPPRQQQAGGAPASRL